MQDVNCRKCGADVLVTGHRDDCEFIAVEQNIRELARAGKVKFTRHVANQLVGVPPAQIVDPPADHDDDLCAGNECDCECAECLAARKTCEERV